MVRSADGRDDRASSQLCGCSLSPIQQSQHRKQRRKTRRLDVELGASPVTTLCVVLDLGVRLQAEPLGNGSVLAGSLSKDALRAESLLGRHRSSMLATASGSLFEEGGK